MKVIQLKPNRIIRYLNDIKAIENNLSHLAIVGVTKDDRIVHSFASLGPLDLVAILGAIEFLKHSIKQEIENRYVED